MARAQACVCGMSRPMQVKLVRGGHVTAYRCECQRCGRSGGWKPLLREAIAAWNNFINLGGSTLGGVGVAG